MATKYWEGKHAMTRVTSWVAGKESHGFARQKSIPAGTPVSLLAVGFV